MRRTQSTLTVRSSTLKPRPALPGRMPLAAPRATPVEETAADGPEETRRCVWADGQEPVSAPKAVAPEVRGAGSGTAYHIYLRELGRIPLLTRREEISLARRIRAGDERAREHMIKANLRLVVTIARAFEGYGLPLLDLISEGNIGLMKAVERYDPAKGAKLSSYASFWIKQGIRRAIANQGRTVRLPCHAQDKVLRIRRVALELQEQLGREPSDEEIAAALGAPVGKVARLRAVAAPGLPLDASVGDEDGASVGEYFADERAVNPLRALQEKSGVELLQQVLDVLDERERKILQRRFGLEDGEEHTLDELGVSLGLTRERVRQIQNAALAKLRRQFEQADLGCASGATLRAPVRVTD